MKTTNQEILDMVLMSMGSPPAIRAYVVAAIREAIRLTRLDDSNRMDDVTDAIWEMGEPDEDLYEDEEDPDDDDEDWEDDEVETEEDLDEEDDQEFEEDKRKSTFNPCHEEALDHNPCS